MIKNSALASMRPEPIRVQPVLLSHISVGYQFTQASITYALFFYQYAISAGFPSPAEDYYEKLDLNELLIKHPAATFFMRVAGNAMIEAGIYDGDIIVVDRSLTPGLGKIVIAEVDGKLAMKRLIKHKGALQFMSENKSDEPINDREPHEITVWGVVTTVLHKV